MGDGEDMDSLDRTDPVVVHRACGAVVGAAVVDALGAPFEFKGAGQYRRRVPEPVLGGFGEMIGGGQVGWAPGQFTDDTEMAMAAAESLLACDGFDADDQMRRFRAWAGGASDVGNLTQQVLSSAFPAAEAAHSVYDALGGRGAAGNGSLMRAAPGAVSFAHLGRDETMEMGRRLADLERELSS